MSTFIHTAQHFPTMTTVDDPLLKVVENDNGMTWKMNFYVGRELIDQIDMEYPKGKEIHPDVKDLIVTDLEGEVLGTVGERLRYALELDNYGDRQMGG